MTMCPCFASKLVSDRLVFLSVLISGSVGWRKFWVILENVFSLRKTFSWESWLVEPARSVTVLQCSQCCQCCSVATCQCCSVTVFSVLPILLSVAVLPILLCSQCCQCVLCQCFHCCCSTTTPNISSFPDSLFLQDKAWFSEKVIQLF